MPSGKKKSKKGTQPVTGTDGRTTTTGTRAQAPPGGSFTPPTSSQPQAIQGSTPQQAAAGWQQTAASWTFWALSLRNPAVAAAASKHGSTWQEHNDFHTIGLLLPGHLDLVPKLLKLFPSIEELTAIIDAVAGDKGKALEALQKAGILALLATSVPRLTGLLKADVNDKLVQLQEPALEALHKVKPNEEIHLIRQLKASTLNTLVPVIGAARAKTYLNCLSPATLVSLEEHGELLAKMQPQDVKALIDAYGAEGFSILKQRPVADLELLAPQAALVSETFPEASEVMTHLKRISAEELLALCEGAGSANLQILLEHLDPKEIYQLARQPAKTIQHEASLLVNFGHKGIGWDELEVLGKDNAMAFAEANQGVKELAKKLKKFSGEWKQLDDASYSIGEALKILITNKKPAKARKIIKDSASAEKLHEAITAIAKLIEDKKQLREALASTPILRDGLTGKSIKQLVRAMTVPEAADFIKAVGDAANLNDLLAQGIEISYFKQLTGAHTATLFTKTDAKKIKALADNLTVVQLTEVVQNVPAQALTNLLGELSALQFADFVKVCGLQDVGAKKGLITLENKYTAASLKHYGHTFFNNLQGVTNATMQHVIDGDGIKTGVSGCHDRTKFMAQPGIAITSDIRRGVTAVYDVKYTIPPDTKVYIKTLIDNLNANKADWRRRATEALDDAIKNQQLTVGGKWSGASIDGYSLEGYYGSKTSHVMDTFYVS